jgi:hypothetical protein
MKKHSNRSSDILEERLSLFKYYDLKDGELVLKDHYKQPTNK